MTVTPEFSYSERAKRATDQPISFLIAYAVANPKIISLAAGLVDYETLPTETLRELVDEVLTDPERGKAALQYGTTAGLESLRQALYTHMAGLDGKTAATFPGSPSEVVVTTGSQQLLHLLTDLLVDPGDIVITAWPTYFVYTGALATLGAEVRSIDMDEDGVVPDALDAVLAKLRAGGELSRVKILYTCPFHQNPMGITMSAARRPQILDIVRRYSIDHRILILEDAAYRELTYEGDPPTSIKSYDTDNEFVALLQTFSKPFSPGLKTGYGLLPNDLIDPVILNKGGRDFGSANVAQHLLDVAISTGAYAKHVALLCARYARKRDAMLKSIECKIAPLLPGEIEWTRPTGGMYVWLTLPERIDTGREGPLFQGAIEEGVLFVPGEYCYPNDPTRTVPKNTIRLSFGVPNEAEIEQGIGRLSRALSRALRE